MCPDANPDLVIIGDPSSALTLVADGMTTGPFIAVLILAIIPWLMILVFGVWKMRKRLAAMMGAAAKADFDALAAAAKGGEAEEADDEDDEAEAAGESVEEVMNDFLDPSYTKGLDDNDLIDINPVMTYKMNQAKKRARAAARAAQMGSEGEGESSASTGGVKVGRPGGLSRLGWKLSSKGAKDAGQKNTASEVKGIEMFLSREEDIDVKHHDSRMTAVAGESALKPSLMAVAMSNEHQSNIGRVGGRRGSTLAITAQQSRKQLQVLKTEKPELFPSGSRASSGDQNYRNSVIAADRASRVSKR